MNKLFLPLIAGALAFASCDDDTLGIGSDIMPEGDNITAESKVFYANTKTVKVGAVLANTNTCYLGSIVDPEMRVKTTCDFLAQFHLPQDFRLPAQDKMLKDKDGKVFADSCSIRLYFNEFYGDSLAVMKLNIQELDKKNVLDENNAYYTDINPNDYVDPNTEYKKTVSYAVKDLSRPSTETDGKSYYRQIVVNLPAKYATNMLRQYYEHPEYFKNSYHFIHNVCPGFYFKNAGGIGSMITTKMMGLNIYFRYLTKTTAGKDTIVVGTQRFGATPEVIQSTRIDNQYPGSLTLEQIEKKGCTYVKTPTGLFTEMKLPVADIIAGEHYTDTISQAKIEIRKYNNETESKYTLAPPQFLLLVRKSKMDEFFKKRGLPDNATSFLSNEFDPASNMYKFNNISQLVTNLRIERDLGAGVKPGDTEEIRNAKYAKWIKENPEWDHVMIVPVSASFTISTDYYGQTIKKIRSIHHNLGLSSARLEGGKDNPLKIEVIYSRQKR